MAISKLYQALHSLPPSPSRLPFLPPSRSLSSLLSSPPCQVITRFIVSSSPVIFWSAATALLQVLDHQKQSISFEANRHSLLETLRCIQKALFPSLKSLNPLHASSSCGGVAGTMARFVAAYFAAYIVLGVLLHCNFLPWT